VKFQISKIAEIVNSVHHVFTKCCKKSWLISERNTQKNNKRWTFLLDTVYTYEQLPIGVNAPQTAFLHLFINLLHRTAGAAAAPPR